MARREFSRAMKVEILRRATVDGRIHCEHCGQWVKSRRDCEIDHILAEGLVSVADRKRKLTPAHGMLLCRSCHSRKTPHDKAQIALAKRQEAAHLGVDKPGKKKIAHKKRQSGGEPKRAFGPPALARRGFIPAGRP